MSDEAVRELERLHIGRLPAARAIEDSDGARLHVTWIAHDEHVYRIARVSRAGAVWSPEQTAISNGIEVDSLLEPGWPVKVPVRESYDGSAARPRVQAIDPS